MGVVVLFNSAAAGKNEQNIAISLKTAVMVENTQVKLVDVAEVITPDIQLKNNLNAILLRRAPLNHHIAYVTREDITQRIRVLFQDVAEHIQWQGPKTVKITTLGQAVSRQQIIETAENYLRQNLPQDFQADDEITATAWVKDLQVPRGQLVLQAMMVNPGNTHHLQRVWVEVKVNGELIQNIPVNFTLKVWRECWLSKRRLEKNQRVQEIDFIKIKKDITLMAGKPVLSLNIKGKVLNRPLGVGIPLLEEYLMEAPEVLQGESVTVLAKQGNVVISTRALALENGIKGQNIQVKSPETHFKFTVWVRARGLVSTEKPNDEK